MSLWLGVCVPGHHEIVAALPAAEHHHHDGHDQDRHHDTRDESGCAVCLFASTMSPPVDLTPSIACHELLKILHAAETEQVLAADRIPTFYGRGPPVLA